MALRAPGPEVSLSACLASKAWPALRHSLLTSTTHLGRLARPRFLAPSAPRRCAPALY
jgi:hypothetical protein